jgi:predicted RNase H-like nuclease
MNAAGRHVGVDGCRAGWIAVTLEGGTAPQVAIHRSFAELLAASGDRAFIAVDMPIGLPDFIGKGGRGPEQAVRPLLGERQSSVFSIPSRAAVECTDYREGCAVALATSDPPRKISRQAFFLFHKVRELDAALDHRIQARVRECHPEVAFRTLNGGRAMQTPKKVKGAINPAGMAERRAVLARYGFDPAFLEGRPPPGAAADDFLDACACALIAGRIARGEAQCFPPSPAIDSRGLQIAIWA